MNCAINAKKIPMKLAIIFMLCEAYYKWTHFYTSNDSKNYIELEHSFYFMLAVTTLTNFVLFFMVLFISFLRDATSSTELIPGLIVCSYGKIFYVPAALWASELSPIVDILLDLLFLFSLAQCYRVKRQVDSIWKSLLFISLAKFFQLLVLTIIYWLTLLFFNY